MDLYINKAYILSISLMKWTEIPALLAQFLEVLQVLRQFDQESSVLIKAAIPTSQRLEVVVRVLPLRSWQECVQVNR